MRTIMSTESFFDTGNNIIQSALSYVKSLLELAQLELKLSCQNIIGIIGLVIFAAMLLFSTWLVLVSAFCVLLHDYGLEWGYSILIVFAGNILLLISCLLAIKLKFQSVGLPRTLEQLKPAITEEAL